MPSFHRIELLRRAFRDKGAAGALDIVRRSVRDAALGQHRLLFAMSGEKAARVGRTAPPTPLDIRRRDDWAALEPETRAALAANARFVWWDMERALAAGWVAWVGHEEGAPVSFAMTRRGDRTDAYFFPMTERCALISHCVTLPEARGRGHYVAMLRHVCGALAAEGMDRVYIDCTDFNVSSERGILSAGFLPIGRGVHRRGGALVWRQETPPSVRRLEAAEAAGDGGGDQAGS